MSFVVFSVLRIAAAWECGAHAANHDRSSRSSMQPTHADSPRWMSLHVLTKHSNIVSSPTLSSASKIAAFTFCSPEVLRPSRHIVRLLVTIASIRWLACLLYTCQLPARESLYMSVSLLCLYAIGHYTVSPAESRFCKSPKGQLC